VSLALEDHQHANITANASNGGARGVTTEYSKPGDGQPGSFGWRTSVTRGDGERATANVSYVAKAAQVDAMAVHTRGSTYANATVTGAIATMGGEVFTARSISDGMAVVDVGYPGVEVSAENRVIGKTDEKGRIFVPQLASHQNNTISIDPVVLPPDIQPSDIKKKVVPMRGSGIFVDMKVKPAPSSALVEFVQADGGFVPAGVSGKVVVTGEEFVVGFDGQGFITALGERNEVMLELESGPCRAKFQFTAKPGEQVFVPKVVCQ
jgi:outer membrane usher protein